MQRPRSKTLGSLGCTERRSWKKGREGCEETLSSLSLTFWQWGPQRASVLGHGAVRAACVFSVGVCLGSGMGGKAKGEAVQGPVEQSR